ncbi:MAG: Na+/H+ antiporter [Nitrospirae bacterium]|nr:Na+/H+ antiporter [Nitrospirota bacterium]
MESLHQLETIILLLTAVLALTTIARRILIPYPILLVIGGLLLGLIPHLPAFSLDPDLVFLVFLPPILWAAAYFTSWRDFRANARPIGLLAVGLVLATTAAVAAVAHAALPGMGWAAAIALGAIVSPPDAVAATAISRRLHLPHRIVTILEGESLVNDATALILYRAAITAVVSGAFVFSHTLLQFIVAATVGIAAGLLVGMLARWTLRWTHDSFSEIAITLLCPYIAWVLAEQFHASGVLACVAGGLYLRRYFSEIVEPATRIEAKAVWNLLVFLLNGVIFILIGLQLGALIDAVPTGQLGSVIRIGALVSLTAIVVRLIWVPLAAWIPRALSPALRARDPMPPWRSLFLIGWTGMRGIVTLAGALALPLTTAGGAPFPYRAELVLITFSVILATLVVQGLTLTPLIRWFNLEEDRTLEREEMRAREQAATAGLLRLEELAGNNNLVPEQVEQLRVLYDRRRQRYAWPAAIAPDCTTEADEAFKRLRRETLAAEHRALIELRNQGIISDEVLHKLEHELDVEALRLGVGEDRK